MATTNLSGLNIAPGPLDSFTLEVRDSTGTVVLAVNAQSSSIVLSRQLDIEEMAAPAVSGSGAVRLYFDSTSKKLRASEDGGAYADVVGGGSGGGVLLPLTYFNPKSGDNPIYWGTTPELGTGSEARAQVRLPACTVTALSLVCASNTLDASHTYTLRKNGGDTALTLTVPSTSTGTYRETGSIAYADGDLLSLTEVNAASTGQGFVGGGLIELTLS